MSWQKDILQPSINGVEFEFEDSTTSGGSKLEDGREKEKSQTKKQAVLRNGVKVRTWNIKGYVFGDDYLKKIKKIEKELAKQTKAIFIHPIDGELQVDIESYSIDVKNTRGRKITFSFTAWEHGDLLYPKSRINKLSKAIETQNKIDGVLQEEFTEKFSVKGQPQFVKDSASNLVKDLSSNFDQMTSGIAENADAIGEYGFQVKELSNNAKSLVEKPLDLYNRIAYNMDLAKTLTDDSENIFTAYKSGSSFGKSYKNFSPTTATRKQELDNQDAMKLVVVAMTTTRSCVAAIELSENNKITTSEQAKSIRDNLLNSIQDLMFSTSNDELFNQLQDLRAQILEAIPGNNNNLSEVYTHKLQGTSNSIIISYELTGSLDSEKEIIARNNIENPAFIGPRDIEVML